VEWGQTTGLYVKQKRIVNNFQQDGNLHIITTVKTILARDILHCKNLQVFFSFPLVSVGLQVEGPGCACFVFPHFL